jgi:hypothetical protein
LSVFLQPPHLDDAKNSFVQPPSLVCEAPLKKAKLQVRFMKKAGPFDVSEMWDSSFPPAQIKAQTNETTGRAVIIDALKEGTPVMASWEGND